MKRRKKMNQNYILSFDLGTSGVKSALIDSSGGFHGCSSKSCPLICPQPGWAEQKPSDIWDAICETSKSVIESAGIAKDDIKGIVFGTYWKGIIPIDKDGKELYNNIIWLDARAGAQAQKMNESLPEPNMFAQEYWPRLLWVKEEMPEIYEKAAYLLETNAYLKYKATGEIVSDYNNNFMFSENPLLKAFYEGVFSITGLDREKFPPLVSSTDKTGSITNKAALEMGVCEGTPVFGGNNDLCAIPIGSGSSQVDHWHIYLGSSGWIGTAVTEDTSGARPPFLPFFPGRELMLSGMQAVGLAFNWVIDQFYRPERKQLGDGIYDFVNRDIEGIEPGSMNMVAAPWINGERPPLSPDAKAVFFNITNLHDRRHFITATMEGICYHLRWLGEQVCAMGIKPMKTIRAVGGCALSAPWMQMLADIIGVPVEVPQNARHAGAIGTAYCAMIGLDYCENFDKAYEMVKIEKVYQPNPSNKATYDKLYGIWTKLYPSLEGLYASLNSQA